MSVRHNINTILTYEPQMVGKSDYWFGCMTSGKLSFALSTALPTIVKPHNPAPLLSHQRLRTAGAEHDIDIDNIKANQLIVCPPQIPGDLVDDRLLWLMRGTVFFFFSVWGENFSCCFVCYLYAFFIYIHIYTSVLFFFFCFFFFF